MMYKIINVIPAKAGIQSEYNPWIPDKCCALSGMTKLNSDESKFGRRDWNRTNDLYHVKVAL